jgi:hypothetical protein
MMKTGTFLQRQVRRSESPIDMFGCMLQRLARGKDLCPLCTRETTGPCLTGSSLSSVRLKSIARYRISPTPWVMACIT